MVDGAAVLAAMIHGFRGLGLWGERGTNLLDTGAWWYEVYETADGGHVCVGPVEEQFYGDLLRVTGLDQDVDGGGPVPAQMDRASWPTMKRRMASLMRAHTRQEWCDRFEGSDACFAPVLDPGEAPEHPHVKERGTFIEVGGMVQPAPAPRFSRTVPGSPTPTPAPGRDTDDALSEWGFLAEEIALLHDLGAVR